MLRRSPLLRQKPWNLAALLLVLLTGLLMLLAVLSVQTEPLKTRDSLHLTATPHRLDLARGERPDSLLLRDPDLLSQGRPAGGDPPGPEVLQVATGVYATNITAIDLQVPSFSSTGYVWFRWDERMQRYLQQHDLRLWQVITPVNLLDIPQTADSVFQPIGADAPIRRDDGSYYQIVAYKGSFYIDRADFRRHPFTRLSLPLLLEADDIELDYTAFRLVPDLQGSGVGQFVGVNTGWMNQGWNLAEYRHHYATDFGFGGTASDYSQLAFDVTYGTSAWSSFWKLLVPLMVVMAMVVGATKMDPAQWEVRLTMPVTVLLTLVFLQQSYSSELPPLPYLSFIDELYVVAYSLTLLSFVLMLWGCRRYYRALEIEDEPLRRQVLQRLDLSDDSWPAAVLLAGLVSGVICWFS